MFAVTIVLTLPPPATASANPLASMSSASASLAAASCFVDNPPYAASATDTTTLSGGWNNAAVNVTLSGTGQQGFEWALECGTVQTSEWKSGKHWVAYATASAKGG